MTVASGGGSKIFKTVVDSDGGILRYSGFCLLLLFKIGPGQLLGMISAVER